MYRLTRGAEKLPTPPLLDPSQRAVVEHAGGPLLVLAGPGTGKTTTLVECVVDRIERRGATPDSILVLTSNLQRRVPRGSAIAVVRSANYRLQQLFSGAVSPAGQLRRGDSGSCLFLECFREPSE